MSSRLSKISVATAAALIAMSSLGFAADNSKGNGDKGGTKDNKCAENSDNTSATNANCTTK